ncbi:MAG: GAF domain-containing sensor histidine kinase [Phototrophicaceae bacterium]
MASIPDLVYPVIVGVLSTLIIAGVTVSDRTKIYVPFIILFADWALIFTYIYTIPAPESYNYLLPLGITLAITLSGIMYVGAIFGILSMLVSLVTLIVAYSNRADGSLDALLNDSAVLLPVVFIMIIVLVISVIWHTTLDEQNSSDRKKVRQEIEESRQQLQDMRERTAAVAEMATRLNSSLQFDRILDASLDIGRMSVRASSTSRVVSMALMVTSEDGELTIETERGLQHSEVHHTFAGQQGIIAQAMETGEPVIYDGGNDDPELQVLNSFALVKSTLVIPLRANFETYGVLVFGSTTRNAINEDHIDTLATIGVQATVALQNAVLFNNLSDEKERILRIEENGRKALVRDLHDIPTQTISAVAMHLSTIPTIAKRYPERLESEIKNIREMSLRATEELRHVMFTIRPLSLESSGLATALGQLAEKMQKTYGQNMQVKIDPKIDAVLDKDAKSSLFYLIEEAANNTRKYAQADIIQVQGLIQDNQVVIRVRDNGKGFDTNAVGANYESRGSFGMVNMRERAELIDGTFDLQSVIGKGTIVTVRVPVKDRAAPKHVPILKPRKPTRKQYTGPLSPSV